MIALLQSDLDLAKRKLAYYAEIKAKHPSKKATPADRWIEIYDERVIKLEKQITKAQAQLNAAQAQASAAPSEKPGLKTQVSANGKSRSRRA